MAVVVPSSDVAQTVLIRDLTAEDGTVSGTIVNNSSKTIRDLELLVRQEWLWNDDLHPGTESPGRTLPVRVGRDIPPRASASFIVETPPLAPRSDGRFVTKVEVARYREVGW
jgi:hypothetical protein